jgi:hypothetical protein
MEKLEFWISNGQIILRPDGPETAGISERALLDRRNLVKATADASSVTIKWHAAAANWSSLHFVKDWIGARAGPFTLHYYLSGWFTETLADAHEARDRIDTIMSKSDVHLSSRVYVKEFDPASYHLPDSLRACLEAGRAPAENSIDCSVEAASGRVKVERIGSHSPIAQLWGLSPVSTPCLSGTTYDTVVSRAYADVLRTGKPHYDHIYAAMMRPDGEIAWIPYQRLVMRHPESRRRRHLVSVVSEIMPVEIAVV